MTRNRSLMILCLFLAILLRPFLPLDCTAEHPHPQTVALVLDTSGSIIQRRSRHYREAVKLPIGFLERPPPILYFVDSATSNAFPLHKGDPMSTTQVAQAAQEYWASATASFVHVLDWVASFFRWLTRNFKLILFNLMVLPILALVYWTINSVGLRLSAPALGVKLYRIPLPGFSTMRHYHGWREIDLANVFAIIQLGLVWVAAVMVMHVMLYGGSRLRSMNEEFVCNFVLSVGIVLLLGDTVLFYIGVGETGGLLSTGGVSLTQIVITIVYTGILLFVAFLHCLLEDR